MNQGFMGPDPEDGVPVEPPSELEQTYAWNWFAYHAGQRLTAFNFFLVVLGAVLVGYVQAVTDDLAALGVVLGLLGVLIAIAFWALDVRNSELVMCGQAALAELECGLTIKICEHDRDRKWLGEVLPGQIERRVYSRLMRDETKRPARRRLYTHTFWLRNVLLAVGSMSAVGMIWAALGFAGR